MGTCIERILSRLMLYGDPLVGSECAHCPGAIKATDARIFFAAKWTIRQIIHRLVVHMGHACLELLREAQAALDIAGKNSGSKSQFRVVCDFESIVFAVRTNEWSDRSE